MSETEHVDTSSPLRTTIPLQKRKILKKSFGSITKVVIGAIIGTVIIYMLLYGDVVELPPKLAQSAYNKAYLMFLWFVLISTMLFSRMIYQILYFLTYFYDMDQNNVVIRKGVVTKREITLPFSKITDVYVDQDLLDVLLGLYDVHISTPTVESGVFAHVDGVNKKGASLLRKMILEKVNQFTPRP